MFARVAMDADLGRLFDYAIPETLRDRALPGARVTVPFGHRTATGYIVELAETTAPRDAAAASAAPELPLLPGLPAPPPTAGLKSIISVDGEQTFILPSLLKLARWIADYYCAPLERCLQAVLPAPVRSGRTQQKEQLFVEAVEETGDGGQETGDRGQETGDRRQGVAVGSGSRQLEQARAPTLSRALSVTLSEAEGEAPPPASPPTTNHQPPTLTPRQQGLLDNIRRVGGGWLQSLCTEFSCAPETLRRLEAAGRITITPRAIRRDPLANRRILPTRPLALNPEQAAALAAIVAACGEGTGFRVQGSGESPTLSRALSVTLSEAAPPASPPTINHQPSTANHQPLTTHHSPLTTHQPPRPLLLYGVTGSGKTEVYLQAIAHVLEQGRGAIVLVPEIALTPQTVQRFAGRFGDRIAVLHSALGDGERYDEWQRIRRGEARVVVGPRSAVFAPVERLGLIVVDEEHEPSYKQDEAPRYHARDVAVMRGHFEPCAVLLGSATPSLESWRNVQRGKYATTRLTHRADHAAMPMVQVVDMRREQARSGHVQVFSKTLLDAIGERLKRGEQTMLFLNRRGYSTSLVCPACGFVATCKACDIAFTYHRADDCLRCHICGAWERPAADCPACHDPKFRYAGFGTQRLEQIIARCFPAARLGRMDADSTSRKLSHDDILGAFRTGRTDILIGTQMIAKGLHFPNVTLVGIVLADSSLHLPDFRAGERTFQLLAQVAGRTGRGATPGEVIIQTYTPGHPAVTAACTEDFEAFAAGELPIREKLGYPPYIHLACLTLRGAEESHVAFTAEALARRLGELNIRGLLVSEAVPAALAKMRNHYRYQIILRASATRTITSALRRALRAARLPEGVWLAVDIDAVSLM
jgi:primosomal protein N' (replication factor Y)